MYQPGDCVVYKKSKHTEHPGPRAQNVRPALRGETYTYFVDKFWVVATVIGDSQGDSQLLLRTRRGKEHVVSVNDPNLRQARWWERWVWRRRFAEIKASVGSKD